MSSFDLRPDLAARLDALVPAEALTGDWVDVGRRGGSGQRRRPRPRRVALALCLLLLLLAVIATATYLAFRTSAPSPGALTVVSGDSYGSRVRPARIVEVRPDGSTRVLWRCPNRGYCGELGGVDWASDGRHLPFTLAGDSMPTERLSTVRPLGLHIVDITTGRDIHIPQDAYSRLGCVGPMSVAWSPNARALAYDCYDEHRDIEVIRRDGTGPRRVPTRLWESLSPTWSPDGKRLAFAGHAVAPSLEARFRFAIYVIRLDGTHRVLVARHGDSPSWSPDGKTIAYADHYGIRLVTPNGVDVTPKGLVQAPAGIPSWSPDGRTLAIAADDGVYLVGKTGAGLRRVTSLTGAAGLAPGAHDSDSGGAGLVRPAWYPARVAPRSRQPAHKCGPC